MRYFSALLSLVLYSAGLFAQENQLYWHDVATSAIQLPFNAEVDLATNKYRSLSLDLSKLQEVLQRAPLEGSKNAPVVVSLPLPNGKMARFAVEASPVMMPKLAAKYPSIQSFSGKSLDDQAFGVRFDLGAGVFHAAIHTLEGMVYIDPYASNLPTGYYFSYFTKDLDLSQSNLGSLSCGLNTTE